MSEINKVLAERESTHGSFSENSEISQGIKELLRMGRSYHKMNPMMKETVDMIAHKLSRAVSGDPYYRDVWTDLTGYPALVDNFLKRTENMEVDNSSIFETAREIMIKKTNY